MEPHKDMFLLVASLKIVFFEKYINFELDLDNDEGDL